MTEKVRNACKNCSKYEPASSRMGKGYCPTAKTRLWGGFQRRCKYFNLRKEIKDLLDE